VPHQDDSTLQGIGFTQFLRHVEGPQCHFLTNPTCVPFSGTLFRESSNRNPTGWRPVPLEEWRK
jgi:hypothetical protein